MNIRVQYKKARIPQVDDFIIITKKDNSQVSYTIKEIRMQGKIALVLLPLGTSNAETWSIEYTKEPGTEPPTGDQLLKKVRESLKDNLVKIDIAEASDTALLVELEQEREY